MKDYREMKRKDFEALPRREDWKEEIICDCLIILPLNKIHDSSYRCMDFVAVSQEKMIRVSGYSDVLHFEGIGGFGDQWLKRFGKVPRLAHPVGWCIDALKGSGLLRIFCPGYKIKCGEALSSFDIFSIPTDKELERRRKFEGGSDASEVSPNQGTTD